MKSVAMLSLLLASPAWSMNNGFTPHFSYYISVGAPPSSSHFAGASNQPWLTNYGRSLPVANYEHIQQQTQRSVAQIQAYNTELQNIRQSRQILAQTLGNKPPVEQIIARLDVPLQTRIDNTQTQWILKRSDQAQEKFSQLHSYPHVSEFEQEIRSWNTFSLEKKKTLQLADQYAEQFNRLKADPLDSEMQSSSQVALEEALESLTQTAHIAGGTQQGDFQESYQRSCSFLENTKKLIDTHLGIDSTTFSDLSIQERIRSATERSKTEEMKKRNISLSEMSQALVAQNKEQAYQILPMVTHQMEQATTEYIKEQIQSSEAISQNAVELAHEGASQLTVKMVSDFALDTAVAINEFLGGVASGVYQGFLSPIEAAKAIYNNPTLIKNLSNNIMMTFSAGPTGVADVAHLVFKRVAYSVYQFELTMAYGSAQERGHALGELGSNVVLSMAGAKATTAARAGLEKVADTLTRSGASEALGTSLNQGMRASEILSPKFAEIDHAVQRIADSSRKIEKFGPIRHGALHNIPLKSGGVVADTFMSGSYLEVTLKEPTKLYRVYGGGAGKFAPYWSRVKPTGPLQATLDSALDPSWGNHATRWVEIVVPPDTILYEGFVSEVALHAGNFNIKVGQLLGGGHQVFITGKIPATWISAEGVF